MQWQFKLFGFNKSKILYEGKHAERREAKFFFYWPQMDQNPAPATGKYVLILSSIVSHFMMGTNIFMIPHPRVQYFCDLPPPQKWVPAPLL